MCILLEQCVLHPVFAPLYRLTNSLEQQARTAIGSFHGQFSKTPAVALGVAAFESALSKSGLKPSQVEDV